MGQKLVVIGVSLGGLTALRILLAALPGDFPLPVGIAQHREAGSGDLLLGLLQPFTALPLSEAEDKDLIVPGRVVLAPADYHLLAEPGRWALSTDEPVGFARPSIDVLFETAADAYGEGVIGVILTGSNDDGARGLAAVKARGGLAVVQDPATAEVRAMPEAAIRAAAVDHVLPVEAIGPLLACRWGTGGR